MKHQHRPVGFISVPTELLPEGSPRRAHTSPRGRRLDLWATGGTLVIGLVLLLIALFVYASPSGAKTNAERVAEDPRDLALVEEFIVTADDTTIPAMAKAEVKRISTGDQDPMRSRTVLATQEESPGGSLEEPTFSSPPPIALEEPMPADISEPAATLSQEALRLTQLPPAALRFDNEPLEIAIAMIADSAGMSYATNGVLEGKVSGALVGNPYRLLRNLSRAYAFDMEYDNGLWTFTSAKRVPTTNQTRRISTRTYPISNNMLERLSMKEVSLGGGSLGTSGGGSSRGGGNSRMASANLLAGQTVFDANYDRMIKDLEHLLKASASSSDEYQSAVFLNEDGNSLLAVGTEEDHQLIKAYLANFDRPQRAIALEVKLVRTKRNPSSLVGVDWSSGMSFDLSGTFDEGKLSLDHLVGGLGGAPTGVLISNSDANITLDAIKNDSMTKRISYIEKMTLDNREVVLSNVVEEPVIADREEVDSESGLRVLLSIEKEIIGTVINILPRIMRDDTIKMRLRLEDSNIVRFKQFFEDSSGGEYPVISKQTYEGPVVIKDGYSLAITGFETTEEIHSRSRVPLLGDIPLLGKAFGRDRTQEERSYLVIFITPRILQDSSTGVDYINRSHHLGRSAPVGPIAGTHFDTFSDLEHYVSGIRRQHDELMQLADVRGVTGDLIEEAGFLYGEFEALASQLHSFTGHGAEAKRAQSMLGFCQTAMANTWRILQQEQPPAADSPAELVQDSSLGHRSVYNAAKARHKPPQRRKRSILHRILGRRKGR